jgi:hypothetical protein
VKWWQNTLDRQEQLLQEIRSNQSILPQAREAVRMLEIRLQHADDCAAIYHTTIDRKSSDLTVREAEAVGDCRTARLYPPEK